MRVVTPEEKKERGQRPSYHKSDPLAHGERLRREQQAISALDALGFKDTATRAQLERIFERVFKGEDAKTVVEDVCTPRFFVPAGQGRTAAKTTAKLLEQVPVPQEADTPS